MNNNLLSHDQFIGSQNNQSCSDKRRYVSMILGESCIPRATCRPHVTIETDWVLHILKLKEYTHRALAHIQAHHSGTKGWIALFQKLPPAGWSSQIHVRITEAMLEAVTCRAQLYTTQTAQEKHIQQAVNEGITLETPSAKKSQWTYTLEQITEDLLLEWGPEDVYFAQNPSFIPGKRTQKALKELRALYVDLDVLKLSPYTVDEALVRVRQLCGEKFPTPNVITESGSGLHLVWWLEPAAFDATGLWKAVQQRLMDMLHEFGPDRSVCDTVRVLRPDGSFNAKAQKAVKVHYLHDQRHLLSSVADFVLSWRPTKEWLQKKRVQCNTNGDGQGKVLPMRDVRQSKERESGPAIVISFAKASRNRKNSPVWEGSTELVDDHTKTNLVTRLQDIELLSQLRGCHMDGWRNRALFIYRVTARQVYGPERALDMMLNLNSRFTHPHDAEAISIQTRYADVRLYRFKTSTIIKWLGITETEQTKLVALRTDRPASKSGHTTRHNKTRAEYRSQALRRMEAIVTLKAKGVSNRKAAQSLGCSEGEVRRLLKQIEIERVRSANRNVFVKKRLLAHYTNHWSVTDLPYVPVDPQATEMALHNMAELRAEPAFWSIGASAPPWMSQFVRLYTVAWIRLRKGFPETNPLFWAVVLSGLDAEEELSRSESKSA